MKSCLFTSAIRISISPSNSVLSFFFFDFLELVSPSSYSSNSFEANLLSLPEIKFFLLFSASSFIILIFLLFILIEFFTLLFTISSAELMFLGNPSPLEIELEFILFILHESLVKFISFSWKELIKLLFLSINIKFSFFLHFFCFAEWCFWGIFGIFFQKHWNLFRCF